MRKELRRELKKRFAAGMRESFPDFTPVEDTGVAPGAQLFASQPSPIVTCFIRLLPSNKAERFTVEIGCSNDGHFREGPNAHDPDNVTTGEPLSMRIGALARLPHGDKWWTLTQRFTHEETMSLPPEEYVARLMNDDYIKVGIANVPVMTAEALALLTQHARPFFERVGHQPLQ